MYKLPMIGARPAWEVALERAGYPTDVLVLDFELYFDDQISMKKMSTVEYIMHPESEVLGAAFTSIDPDEGSDSYLDNTFWLPGSELSEFFERVNWDSVTVVAQNSAFDMSVLAHLYGIYPTHHIDLLGLARAWHTRTKNDLATLCKRYNLPDKGDTAEFKEYSHRNRWHKHTKKRDQSKMPRLVCAMTDEQHAALAEYALNDAMREWEAFTILMPRLSNPHTELRVMQHTIELFTRPRLVVDTGKAEELKCKMDAQISGALLDLVWGADIDLTRKELGGNAFEDTLWKAIEEAGDNPKRYTKPAKSKKGWKFAIAKDDVERELLVNHENEAVRLLMAAKAAKDSWPLHINRVERIVNQSAVFGLRLAVPLKYWGAHTGRWSGGEKINLQNLGSRGHELVNAVRELLCAPDGYELVIADASQIEARVCAWIAGQYDLLERFDDPTTDIYCEFASKVLGRPIRKPDDTMDAETYAYMKWARNSIGKVGVLGGGYGMGADKAVSYAKGEIDKDTAKRLIDTYRAENDKIKKFWDDIGAAFVYVAKYNKPCRLNGLQFYSYPDCDVVIQLPNGRELKYHRVRIERDNWGDSIRVYNDIERKWDHFWGGHLTENVVQAMSRDILWGAIWKMEHAGHEIVHHVHDELIAMVPEGRGEEALATAIEFLSETPDWAPRLPLDAEGLVTTRYGGH
jgi:DNA polymerase